MDEPGLDAAEHAAALRGLGRINVLSRSATVLWPAITRLVGERPGAPLRVLDVASGGGHVPIALARLAARARLDVRIDGCDVSPSAIAFARQRASAYAYDVSFFRCDALTGSLPDGYDVITSTLFLHHLDDAAAVDLLRRMRDAAGRMVMVDDLVRSRKGHALAWAGCRLLTTSKVVHHDGPVSVAAAFTVAEAADLASRAGLRGASLTRHWPERFLLAWSRS